MRPSPTCRLLSIAASTALFTLLAAGLTACGSDAPKGYSGGAGATSAPGAGGGGGGATAGTGGSTEPSLGTVTEESQACTKMDIVFVVDDSGSMAEEQKNLTLNFPKFVSVLDAFKSKAGALIDYRVAVTTTGRTMNYTVVTPPIPVIGQLPPTPMSQKGDDGAFRSKCAGMTRPWIERADATRVAAFECAAQVGTSGPSIEMPLETMRRALRERIADKVNGAFLRDDALLAVVLLTDEDDCSRGDDNFTVSSTADVCTKAEPPASYVAFLDGLKGPGRWATAVVAGPGPGSCTSTFGEAAEGTRLKSFVTSAGKNGTFSSICAGDLSKSLDDALGTFSAACQSFTPR